MAIRPASSLHPSNSSSEVTTQCLVLLASGTVSGARDRPLGLGLPPAGFPTVAVAFQWGRRLGLRRPPCLPRRPLAYGRGGLERARERTRDPSEGHAAAEVQKAWVATHRTQGCPGLGRVPAGAPDPVQEPPFLPSCRKADALAAPRPLGRRGRTLLLSVSPTPVHARPRSWLCSTCARPSAHARGPRGPRGTAPPLGGLGRGAHGAYSPFVFAPQCISVRHIRIL